MNYWLLARHGRLISPAVQSYLMGWPAWPDELKALGNGQVPAVAAAAWHLLAARMGLA